MINKYILIFLTLTFGVIQFHSQGVNCLGVQPFCTDQSYTFPASTNTTAQNGPDYQCLSMQPNPAWYYLQIGTTGDIDITLTNSQNEDIDFICWGPFTSPTSACTSLLTYDDGNPSSSEAPCGTIQQIVFGIPIGNPPVSNYPCGNTVDCSYDPQAVEIVNIPNAQIGDYYILMITNFSGVATDITAQQTGGTGATDCSIVVPCTITAVTASVSTCNATTNNYTVSGSVSFTDPPATGQLIIEDCSGTQLSYNAPFGNSQAYLFSGLNSNGTSCDITAYFTDELTCTNSIAYTAPANCSCNANAGTSTITINGLGTNNYVLCDGDAIDIQSNNDYTPPNDNGIINGASYNPDLGYAIYFCPPTPNTSPINDPCFSGYMTGTLGSFTETNTGGTSPLLSGLITNGVNITNNTIYLAPVTLYDGTTQTYDAACVHVGTPIEITYLQPITTSAVESCLNNNSVITISGGYPSFNASNFTLTNTTPANINFSSTNITNGGTTTLTGFTPGESYSFDINDNNGCTLNFSSSPFGGLNVDSYDTTICIGGTAILTPIITGGTAPLVYLWDNGANTTSISSTPTMQETNCVTVTDASGCSSGLQCFTINLHPNLNITMSNDTTICLGGQAQITANVSGGIGSPYLYTWDNGLSNTNSHSVTPLINTTYNLMVSDGCETPVESALIQVDVIEPPTFSFTANIISGCPPLPVTFTSNGIPIGYTQEWTYEDENGSIMNNNGNYIFTSSGCWNVNLTTTSPEGCIYYDSIVDYICLEEPPIVDFIFTPAQPTTFAADVDFLNQSTGNSYDEWYIIENSDTLHYSSTDITHSFPTEQGGNYEVCLKSSNSNACVDSLCKTVVVLDDLLIYVPNSFTPGNDDLNDIFIPFITGDKDNSYSLQIYNKWGDIIFESTDKAIGWNGYKNNRMVKTDVYVWKIVVADNINNKEHQYMGHVSLIK